MVSDAWKKGVIMSVFRMGRKEDLNYRLVSVASVPGKTMEKSAWKPPANPDSQGN